MNINGNVITVPTEKYDRLIQAEARIQTMISYVNHTRYSIDREVIGAILGFTVNEVKDGTD